VLERLHLQRLVAEGDLDADAAARGERDDLVGGETALGEDVEHFAPDIAGRSDHRDFAERHRANLSIIAKPGDRCPARNPKHKPR
jgi:hypothetical protein